MMLPAMLGLLTVVLTVAGPVDAVISRSIDTTPERAEDLLGRVAAALAQAGIPVRETQLPAGTVPGACAARRACVRELGAAMGARAIVGVDVGHVTGQMAVNLEAISVGDGQRLAQHSFAIDSAGYPAGLEAQLKTFTRALKLALGPEDAPVAVKLAPEPPPASSAPIAIVEPPHSRPIAPIVLGGVAVAVAVASVALAVLGSSTAGQIDAAKITYLGAPASKISRNQADGLAAAANSQYTAAGISAGAAVALGAGALLSWGLSE